MITSAQITDVLTREDDSTIADKMKQVLALFGKDEYAYFEKYFYLITKLAYSNRTEADYKEFIKEITVVLT